MNGLTRSTATACQAHNQYTEHRPVMILRDPSTASANNQVLSPITIPASEDSTSIPILLRSSQPSPGGSEASVRHPRLIRKKLVPSEHLTRLSTNALPFHSWSHSTKPGAAAAYAVLVQRHRACSSSTAQPTDSHGQRCCQCCHHAGDVHGLSNHCNGCTLAIVCPTACSLLVHASAAVRE